MKLRSPNELLEAARASVLGGREPGTHEEWLLIFNYLAAIILPEAQPGALKIFKLIYGAPVSEAEIEAISKFQIESRR